MAKNTTKVNSVKPKNTTVKGKYGSKTVINEVVTENKPIVEIPKPIVEVMPKAEIKPYVPEPIESQILKNNGIVLENKQAMVKQIGLFLTEISRAGYEVTLKGYESMATKNIIEVKTSLRSVLYLNTKSIQRINPFNKTEYTRFLTQTEGQPPAMKPAYCFYVNVLVHCESGLGYGITFKKLTPLNKRIFEGFMKGENVQETNGLYPFQLGVTEIPTVNGNITVNFGFLNGNSGISITNAKGIKAPLTYKHLPNSVYMAAKQVLEMAKNEGVQLAANVQEMKECLETFKSITM